MSLPERALRTVDSVTAQPHRVDRFDEPCEALADQGVSPPEERAAASFFNCKSISR